MFRPLHFVLLPALILLFSAPAFGHRVSIFAWVEDGKVHTQSRFSKKKPVKHGTVDVLDPASGKIILSGPVSETGEFVFDIPAELRSAPRDLTLVINAGEGHKGKWSIAAEELGTLPSTSTVEAAAPAQPASEPQQAGLSSMPPQLNADLERTLDRILEKKLAPLRRQLAESMDNGPGITEIIGGIGWLIGLAGIAAWFQSRKKTG